MAVSTASSSDRIDFIIFSFPQTGFLSALNCLSEFAHCLKVIFDIDTPRK